MQYHCCVVDWQCRAQALTMTAVSAAAEEAYAKRKPPKGRPWPKDRFMHKIKRTHPAKIVLVGPDHISTSSTLAQLRHFGYNVHHIAKDTTNPRVFTMEHFESLVVTWERFCDM